MYASTAARRTLVKICGLRRPQDVEAANAALPDMVGFILSQGFRRSVSVEDAYMLIERLDARIAHVGVFVNEPVENVVRFACACSSATGDTDRTVMLQLHGDEDDSYISQLRRSLASRGCANITILKAFTVRVREDVARACMSSADLVLLDNGQGTGETFDWSLLEEVTRPYILAGGLGPDNVVQAIERLHPYAIDMSSGVETDGWKDPCKMAAAVAAARSCSREGVCAAVPNAPRGAANENPLRGPQ